MPPNVFWLDNPLIQDSQKQLLLDVGLEVTHDDQVTDDRWIISNNPEGKLVLCYRLQKESKTGQLSFDWSSKQMRFRLQQGGGRQEMLAKALGLKKNPEANILDATAGMGREAFLLSSWGAAVTAVEQSAVLFVLLKDAMSYFKKSSLIQSSFYLDIRYGRSEHYLEGLEKDKYPDMIYIDPMFPERQKSALVKSEMRVLKKLVGNEQTSYDKLMMVALKKVKNRVVVKRPANADCLGYVKPAYQMISGKYRFDIYKVM